MVTCIVNNLIQIAHTWIDRFFGKKNFFFCRNVKFWQDCSHNNASSRDSIVFSRLYIHSSFPRFYNSFLVSGDFCRLLITFANILDPGQYRQNVGPDLDTVRLPLWKWSWKFSFTFFFFFWKSLFWKTSAGDKKFLNYPARRVNYTWTYRNHSRCYMRSVHIQICQIYNY